MEQLTSKQYLKMLSVLHTALLFGQLIFIAIVFYLINSIGPFVNDPQFESVLQIVCILIIVCGVTGSTLVAKARLKSVKQKALLGEKLAEYRGVFIIKLAMLEGPALFAVVCLLLTGNYLFLALSGVVIILFLFNRPTVTRITTDLELDIKERSLLENPDSVIE